MYDLMNYTHYPGDIKVHPHSASHPDCTRDRDSSDVSARPGANFHQTATAVKIKGKEARCITRQGQEVRTARAAIVQRPARHVTLTGAPPCVCVCV